ncbi:MAG: hypothetical protein M1274_06810 [Actinobacteria bacterium]|nr:hypothetical protein [Actinomycetota bacterium]
MEELRPGSDIVILGLGPGVQLALQAAELLSAQGVSAAVANVRRVHPLDSDSLLKLVARHKAVLTVEDNALAGGFGSGVLELLAESEILMPVGRVGLPD